MCKIDTPQESKHGSLMGQVRWGELRWIWGELRWIEVNWGEIEVKLRWISNFFEWHDLVAKALLYFFTIFMFQKSTNIHRVTLMFSSTLVYKIDRWVYPLGTYTLQHRASFPTPILHYCSPIYYVYFCSSVRSKRCMAPPMDSLSNLTSTSLYCI